MKIRIKKIPNNSSKWKRDDGGHMFQNAGLLGRTRPIDEILANQERPVMVLDNTNVVQPVYLTPEQRSRVAAKQAFMARHKDAETEKQVERDLRNYQRDLNARQYGTISEPQDGELAYAWRRLQNNYPRYDWIYLTPGIGTARFGVDIGEDLYSGNYEDAAINLLAAEALGHGTEKLLGAANKALRPYRIANKIKNGVNDTSLQSLTFSNPEHQLFVIPRQQDIPGPLTFFERPSRLTEAERLGIPKGERNNIGGIHPDSEYGNMRFIRVMEGVPPVDEEGLVHLGKDENLLTNFTTDLPFRLHGNYSYIPGSTYISVSPRAFKDKRFLSIEPGDSFLHSHDARVSPKYVRVVSGNPAVLAQAERSGMRTYTTDKLKEMFDYADMATKDQLEFGYVNKRLPFGKADFAAKDIVWGKGIDQHHGYNYPGVLDYRRPAESAVNQYRKEIDRIFTDDFGRPSRKDYSTLEGMTGLNADLKPEYSESLVKNSTVFDPFATQGMFLNVYYDAAPLVEYNLLNKTLHILPFDSYDRALSLINWADRNKIKPLKYRKGGIIWDQNGQWSHPGQITGINGSNKGTDITMNGVADYLLGIDNLGNKLVMEPGNNYHFDGSSVIEYPLMSLVHKQQNGGLASYMTPSQIENVRGIWDYLIGLGISPRNTAVLMGNSMQESSLNPNAKNSKSSAKGYLQMIDAQRKKADAYSKKNGLDTDLGQFNWYNHLINDNIDTYMDEYNRVNTNLIDSINAYEKNPTKNNEKRMKSNQDYYDKVYKDRAESGRLFPVSDLRDAWNNPKSTVKQLVPLFEETFMRSGSGAEHDKRIKYAYDIIDYFAPDERFYEVMRNDPLNYDSNGNYMLQEGAYNYQYGGLIKPFSYSRIPDVRYGNGGHLFQ